MPKISKRGNNMPESPIRKLVPYAENAKKKGVNVLHLNIGQPDIKTPVAALNAVKNMEIDVLAYSRSEGSENLRTKFSNYYKNLGLPINPKEINITIGGSEALSATIGAIADEGDEIIIAEPFYANYNGFTAANGVKVVPIVSHIENNFALPPISEFEKSISEKTKAILICNPNNPTGYLYSETELRQLADLVKKHDIFLIADEVYREFVYEDKKHISVLSFEFIAQNTIVIDSVSKRYSMCGARVGAIVTKNKAIIATTLKFAQARLSPPTLALMASEAALDTPSSYFEEVKEEYISRRNLLVEELQKIEGLKISKPKGAFYCIAELPVHNAEDFAKWLLEDFSLNNETVMVAPANGFYASKTLGLNQIRIAYVLGKEKLLKATTIIKEALKQYPN